MMAPGDSAAHPRPDAPLALPAGPEPDRGEPDDPQDTCGDFEILDICEQAHRDVTGQPLCLEDRDVRTEQIRSHLERCARCQRWYRNARRAYRRLAGDGTAAAPEPLTKYVPRQRRAKEVKPAAKGPNLFLQKLEALPDGQGLDGLTVLLEWHREAQGPADGGRWWLTLRLTARRNDDAAGGDDDVLRRLNGYGVRVERQVRGKDAPDQAVTRLGFDSQKNLVSIPRSLDSTHPRQADFFVLTLLDRVKGVEGD